MSNSTLNKNLVIAALLMTGATTLPALADRTVTSEEGSPNTRMAKKVALDASDRQMLTKLAQGNQAEVDAAKLALEKSDSDAVKSFAQRMIDDHSKGLKEIHALAKDKEVKLPKEADKKHQAALSEMKKLSGPAFDQKYLAQAGHADHQATLQLLKEIEKDANDADLKMLAKKMEPVVQSHLRMVEDIKSK